MIVAAHRGGGGKRYAENSLEAFLSADDMGVAVIELDVQMTADGDLIVQHDSADKYSGELVCQRVTSPQDLPLETVLTRVTRPEFILDLKEIRCTSDIAVGVIELTERLRCTDRVIFASFNEFLLKRLADEEQARHIRLRKALVTGNASIDHFAEISERLSLTHVIVYKFQIDRDTVDALHRRGQSVFSYTINTEGLFRYALSIGVDGIISDVPLMFTQSRH